MSPTNRAYICLACLLKSGRQSFSTSLRTASNSNPTSKSPSAQSIIFDAAIQPSRHHLPKNQTNTPEDRKPSVSGPKQRQPQDVAKLDSPTRKVAPGDIVLEASERDRLRRLGGLLKKVSASATTNSSTHLPVSEAVKQSLGTLYLEEQAILMRLVEAYGDRDLTGFSNEIHRISQLGSKKLLKEENLRKLAKDIQGAKFFGINVTSKGEPFAKTTPAPKSTDDHPEKKAKAPEESNKSRRRRIRIVRSRPSSLQGATATLNPGASSESVKSQRVLSSKPTLRGPNRIALERARARIGARKEHANGTVTERGRRVKEAQQPSDPFSKLEPEHLQTVHGQDLAISPVEWNVLPVPGLAHDLSRVLFNPGIYQLQDPRSRVFNFDPYLQHIMPVAEFDFDALKDYITSSKDDTLGKIAADRGRKYVGSSSSMTGMLVHFHFLLSHWREINTSTLSRGFPEKLTSFTAIQRAPSAIFLRWKDGHYAIDADKEYDSANILMSLGKSMEKLLTLEKDEFERYRKSNQTEFSEEERSTPESYHYSEMGKFLMRSQLDAYDPRLPGTGMFDLKTRAVVSIRMNTTRHQEGLGYQIRQRFGGWESYEREFFDMIRSAFLKYSLQVRMGRMDGIFVAFHNIERIFGFQYVSLPELDLHLHGQSDTTLGDQEFKISLAMLEEIFDRATKKYPKQSLRFHFETRSTVTPVMYVFAEPVDEEEIGAIQDSKKDEIAEIEKRIFGMAGTQTARPESNKETDAGSSPDTSPLLSDSSAADTPVTFLDSIGKSLKESIKSLSPSVIDLSKSYSASQSSPESTEVLGMVLTIRNKVNGQIVLRPTDVEASDKWTVEYTLTEIDSPGKARGLYLACKQRRKTELSKSEEEQDTAANYYLRKIKEITQQGKEWRREQDELDRGREAIVLYGLARRT